MKLEQQVCSLEISRRLKELGVKQESYFYWITFGPEPEIIRPNYLVEKEGQEDMFSAFTVAELGEMLPIHFMKKSIRKGNEKIVFTKHLFISKQTNGYAVWYGENYFDNIGYQVEKNEADARGKMLIYLLENKLITI